MGSHDPLREAMTWGAILDHEQEDVRRKAKTLFSKAKSKLSVQSGHTVSGIEGNDRALACLCLCLVKSPSPQAKNRHALEAVLQRGSGVSPKIFSKALKELFLVLSMSSNPSTPTRRPPKNTRSTSPPDQDLQETPKRRRLETADTTPRRETARAQGSARFDQRQMTSKKLMDQDEDRAPADDGTPVRTMIHQGHLTKPASIQKNLLPRSAPPTKPICIFTSASSSTLSALTSSSRRMSTRASIRLDDWNWKTKLFDQNFKLDDVLKYHQWFLKSNQSSLS